MSHLLVRGGSASSACAQQRIAPCAYLARRGRHYSNATCVWLKTNVLPDRVVYLTTNDERNVNNRKERQVKRERQNTNAWRRTFTTISSTPCPHTKHAPSSGSDHANRRPQTSKQNTRHSVTDIVHSSPPLSLSLAVCLSLLLLPSLRTKDL